MNKLNFDLHNHTSASDGVLSSEELVALAARNGCDALAITDHDTVSGIAAGALAAARLGLKFIPGVEISVTWSPAGDVDARETTIHIVGLGIDVANAALVQGLASVRGGRIARGREIARLLVEAGQPDVFDDAFQFAENKEMLGRTHFARALVARGIVPDIAAAFKRFLTPGNPGYVPFRWASLSDAVKWIHAAGGVAVIAHPARYRLDSSDMDKLFTEFRALGGEGVEVVTGSHDPSEYAPVARRAKAHGLFASRGADFHAAHETPKEPGTLPTLADVDRDLKPVWGLLEPVPGQPQQNGGAVH